MFVARRRANRKSMEASPSLPKHGKACLQGCCAHSEIGARRPIWGVLFFLILYIARGSPFLRPNSDKLCRTVPIADISEFLVGGAGGQGSGLGQTHAHGLKEYA